MMLKLMYITNKPELAVKAQMAGIDRIFIDLEKNGKLERQGHLDTHISDHCMSDISEVRKVINSAELLVRVNPPYAGTKDEVDKCIELGADIIMLPMFKSRKEVEAFVGCVDKRAKVCLLLETSEAMVRVNDIVEVEGVDEIHVGLNDLHFKLRFEFYV